MSELSWHLSIKDIQNYSFKVIIRENKSMDFVFY